MNIFNIVPNNFFNILSSKNKEMYYDCLKILQSLYDSKMGFSITKEEAIDAILEYFDDSEKFEIDSDEGEKIVARERANYILDKFEKTGWITVETSNDYIDMINFRYYSLTVLESLDKICQEQEEDDFQIVSPFEYKGYLFSIYTLLNSRDVREYSLLLHQVHRLAMEFINEIKKINLKLKDYIDSISKRTDIKELMEMLVDYKNQLIDKSYQRLKTYDNIDRYKRVILERLETLSTDEVVINSIVGECMLENPDVTYDMAKIYAETEFGDTMEIFYSLDELIEEIELKNKIYINSTITKIKFLLSNETDVLGKLNYILKKITKHNLSEGKMLKQVNELFSICRQQQLNENSLYTPKVYRRGLIDTPIKIEENPDLTDLQSEFLKEFDLEYSEERMFEFIDKVLDKYGTIKASQLFNTKPNEDMLLRLLYTIVYSSTSESYVIGNIGKTFENDDFILNDFEISRR